jgi:hypothetical protein
VYCSTLTVVGTLLSTVRMNANPREWRRYGHNSRRNFHHPSPAARIRADRTCMESCSVPFHCSLGKKLGYRTLFLAPPPDQHHHAGGDKQKVVDTTSSSPDKLRDCCARAHRGCESRFDQSRNCLVESRNCLVESRNCLIFVGNCLLY